MLKQQEYHKFVARAVTHKKLKKRKRLRISFFIVTGLLISISIAIQVISAHFERESQLFVPAIVAAKAIETEVEHDQGEKELVVLDLINDDKKNREVIQVSNKEQALPDKVKTLPSPKVEAEKINEEEVEIVEVNSKANQDEPNLITIHQVKPKETLYSITMKYYLDSSFQTKVAGWNDITDPSIDVKVGLTLEIPDPVVRYHQIESGDTLFSITNKYYGSVKYQQALAVYNGIIDPTVDLKKGMYIMIPQPDLLIAGTAEEYRVEIAKSENTLTVYSGTKVVKQFSVATGKEASLTPEGLFTIINRVEKPWYNKDDIPGGDPKNPLGSHWLGLNVPGTNGTTYGIHGTNNPDSIGEYVSLGCVRMHNRDVQWLYEHLPLRTLVHIF
ncbi:MAG: L,D-transpeptidase family protein [Bacillaceae bacterium]|nr:L,D-transpeptidase family protein [Bacillaceae bacterium]